MKNNLTGKSGFWSRVLGLTAGVAVGFGALISVSAAETSQQRAAELERELEEMRRAQEGIVIGPLSIGGAIRANYIYGDNTGNSGPRRGGGDNFEFDAFCFNIDFNYREWIASAEYRFYEDYNMLHTGWVGYNFPDGGQIQVGVNRVPFGPGPYGVSQSWFFDQHYYMGLSNDMDLGVKYTMPLPDMTLDLAYYLTDEGHWRGNSNDSARYSYDVVNETGQGYEEWHQVNLRAVLHFDKGVINTNLGASLQYGLLESQGPQSDGYHYAGSAHMVNEWNNFTLASQFTYFNHGISNHTLSTGETSNALIDMGAYDFAWPVAAEGFIPAVSLSYLHEVGWINWLDYVIPYVEYSSIIKSEAGFNNSDMFTIGSAWSRGGWYIHTDLAYSNGNYSVSEDGNFGSNVNNDWNYRFNINFGYYF